MDRITVYAEDDYGMPRKLGWFDLDAATHVAKENVRYVNGNPCGLVSGMQTNRAHLYRTKGGRWVEHRDARSEGGLDDWTFLTDEQARDWLVKAEVENALKEWFPETPDESVPEPKGGRPPVGPTINVAYPRDLLDKIDAAAGTSGMSRAAWLRKIAADAVADQA
jgi:hypothetical protein